MKNKVARMLLGDVKFAELERKHKPRGCLSKGMPNRRIIASANGREFHATKGPREYASRR